MHGMSPAMRQIRYELLTKRNSLFPEGRGQSLLLLTGRRFCWSGGVGEDLSRTTSLGSVSC